MRASHVGMGEGEEKTNGLGRVWRAFRFFFVAKRAFLLSKRSLLNAQGWQALWAQHKASQGIFADKTQMEWRRNEEGAQPKWFCFFQKKETVANHFARALPRNDCLLRLKEASKMMWELSLAPEACHFGAFSRLRGLGLRSPKPLWRSMRSLSPAKPPRVQGLKSLPKRWLAKRRFSPFPFLYPPHKTKKSTSRGGERSILWFKGPGLK